MGQEMQRDYRARVSQALQAISDLIESVPEAKISHPEKNNLHLIETFVDDIQNKYLQHTDYNVEAQTLVKAALSLASEHVYLDDFYKNFNQESPVDDFQALERMVACVDDQKKGCNLDRTGQIEKYQKLPELKRKVHAQRQFGLNDAEIEANDLMAELRDDLSKNYKAAVFKISFISYSP